MVPKKQVPPPETRVLTYPHKFPDLASIEELVTLRGPALLLDGGELTSPTEASAYFRFKPEHPCFVGHWPGHPTVPNYLWQEMVGQAASLLLAHLDTAKVPELVPTFRSVVAKFHGNAYPGNTVHIRARLVGPVRWSAGGLVTGSVVGEIFSHRSDKPIANVRIKFEAQPRNQVLTEETK